MCDVCKHELPLDFGHNPVVDGVDRRIPTMFFGNGVELFGRNMKLIGIVLY
ncbi:hypothetical protein D3C73_1380290 [compost metagenome]